VGVHEDVAVDIQEKTLQKGDYVLLCSDGLTKMIKNDQIYNVIHTHVEPSKIVEELINQANAAGGGDNITAIVARVENSSFGSLAERVKSMFSKKSGRG
jgi:protein phosphatase